MQDQTNKNEKNKKALGSAALALSIALCFFSALSCGGTTDYKLDRLGYSLNNYNKLGYYDEDFHNPIVNVHKKPAEGLTRQYNQYKDLFSDLYYSPLVGAVREPLNNDISCCGGDTGEEIPVKLFTQNTFSIKDTPLPAGGYYVDYGLFSSYFSSSDLGQGQYLTKRFGCDSFVYISDTLADKLLIGYGIDSYEELINDEKYAVLTLTEGGNTVCRASINTVLYSDKRQAPRTYELYGDFAVIYVSQSEQMYSWVDISFEADLKVDPYGSKEVLKSINQRGYTNETSDLTFYRYDSDSKQYVLNEQSTSLYKRCYMNSSGLFWCLFVVLASLSIASYIYSIEVLQKYGALRLLARIVPIAIFVIYSLITTFLYSYPFWSVPLVLVFCISIFDWFKELTHERKEQFFSNFRI